VGVGVTLLIVTGPTTHQSPVTNRPARTGSAKVQVTPYWVMEWRDRFAQVDVPSTITCLDALIKRDSIVERLPEIHVPTLVLVGKEDQSLPVPISRRIHDGLPASEYFEIPGAGHLSALEQPNVVNDTIVQFMDRHFPAGT
jgi:pimeloyl-ACP methyl ester carboxylesterase